ncbi:AGC family protein kinase [Histomonas meleagridis]|uniref:AGC family protein kinase n=1 Tax=Histomonas meleagridis TaxID=135588 RepID=UPI00355A5A5B|nr:AGC family protein kinase [Histomonas meleagridis]KAH0806632.1 AGC family protein kinase [Histomonas meleagridis]
MESGWLKKRGRFRKWKKHWFVLQDQTLYYYSKPGSKVRGHINLKNAEFISRAPECHKQPAIKINIPCRKTFFLVASTQKEADDWISSLEDARGTQENSTSAKPAMKDFHVISPLGRSTYGKVYLVRNKHDHQLYAMKTMDKATLEEFDQVDQVLAERNVLLNINHPFLVKARFTFQTDTKVSMVMDYVPGGELFKQLKEEGRFNESRARFYAAEIALGIGHLHSIGVIYRNLMSSNILVDKDGHIKITAMSLVKPKTDLETTTTFCGTPEYIPPEMLQNVPYTKNVDWWSFGILLFEMLTGNTPFQNENIQKTYQAIVHNNPTFPDYLSTEAMCLITKLLEKNPSERCGAKDDFKEVLSDPFFAGINQDDLLNKRIQPEWIPEIKEETDTSHFDSDLSDDEILSINSENTSVKEETQSAFQNFTCTTENSVF